MKFKGFVGPSYKLDSVNADSQRTVNLYPEVVESGTGKEGIVALLKNTPGLRNLGLGLDEGVPVRLIHTDKQGRIFVVVGINIFKAELDGTTFSFTDIGGLATETGIVNARSAVIDKGVTVFVDGTRNYLFWAYGSSEDFGSFFDFGYIGVAEATHICYIDGYFIFNKKDSNQFFVSEWNGFNVDPLSFASAEGDPDNIIGMIEFNRDLWLVNERSTEVFSNVGNSDFPFERVQGGFVENGGVAPYSIAKIGGVVAWLSRNEFGQGQIVAGSSLSLQRISTHAIEQAISQYADISKATAFTYEKNGHQFYQINFDEASWVYDFSTSLWHERAYCNNGVLERHRADVHCFIPTTGMHIVGDYANGSVYELKDDYYYDDQTEITKLRVFPHISSEKKRLFHHSLEIDMETGVGLDGFDTLLPEKEHYRDPQAILYWSDDGGKSWSNEKTRSIGKKGVYKQRVKFERLGASRDRVYALKITDPVKVVLLDADIEVSLGDS